MSNTTKACLRHDATGVPAASPAGILTISDSLILGSVMLAAFAAILHMWSLQREHEDKALRACVRTLETELPPLKERLTDLQASLYRTSKMHHLAVGVLDGMRYNQAEMGDK